MQVNEIKNIAINALDDAKALNIKCLDVKDISTIADHMLIASGTSKRHVRSVAENLVVKIKKSGMQPIGTEGEDEAEWILVDLGDVLVNIMMPDARERYDLEKLWSPSFDQETPTNSSQ